MKKTKFMRAALLLLVLTLITSCFVGGTFAKYTTSANGTDTARVAKWGFQPTTISLDNLFSKGYAYAYTSTTGNSVSSSVDVIAPGTKGEATFGFTYGGATGINAPEVAYTFVVSTEGSTIADDINNNTNIQWKLDNGEWGTWDALITAIEALDGNKAGNRYEPNSLPVAFNATGNNEHTVYWQWLFETKNDDVVNAAQDTTDTGMGNDADLANVTLKITVSATQID